MFKRRMLSLLLSVIMVMMLSACGNKLKGTYSDDIGHYSVEFRTDGTCTWFQDGYQFDGTYEKVEDAYMLYMKGNYGYSDTTFEAKKQNKSLIITGGVVNGQIFTKQ